MSIPLTQWPSAIQRYSMRDKLPLAHSYHVYRYQKWKTTDFPPNMNNLLWVRWPRGFEPHLRSLDEQGQTGWDMSIALGNEAGCSLKHSFLSNEVAERSSVEESLQIRYKLRVVVTEALYHQNAESNEFEAVMPQKEISRPADYVKHWPASRFWGRVTWAVSMWEFWHLWYICDNDLAKITLSRTAAIGGGTCKNKQEKFN